MIQVKVLDAYDEDDLTHKVNNWIENNPYEIKDIKFSTSHFGISVEDQVFCFSAMIIYVKGDSNE